MPKLKPAPEEVYARHLEACIWEHMALCGIKNVTELAGKLHLTQQGMSYRMTHITAWNLIELIRLCNILDIPAEELAEILKGRRAKACSTY